MLIASSNRCGLSYQRVVETIADTSVVQKPAVPFKRASSKRKQGTGSGSDDEPRHFRRVRMKCRQRARNQDRQDEAGSEALSDLGIRCICGAKDTVRLLGDYSDPSLSVSMASTWLIQCIDCKVWQHRSCVGTANGNDPPSGYHCEQCQTLNTLGLDQDDLALLREQMARARYLKRQHRSIVKKHAS